jgi:hypothetical protein
MSEGINVRPKNWLVPVALVTLQEKSTYGYELNECCVVCSGIERGPS